MQFPGNPTQPTSYFGRATAIGLALDSRRSAEATRVGVIGLGIGTLAAYGRPGDLMRFYEIDPAVVRIARDTGDFAYLEQSQAEIEVVEGDARIALADEQTRGERQEFDVLIVDAFNSDAVPVHLLTRETFDHYVLALAPGGLLAVHVSSRHFDLRRLVARMGLEAGLQSVRVENHTAGAHNSARAWWVLLARSRSELGRLSLELAQRHGALGLPSAGISIVESPRAELMHLPIWTDDYSDLFSLLIRTW